MKKLTIAQDFSDKRFRDEVNCLMRANHNNIVRFLGYCADTQGELMEHNGRNVMAEVRQRLLCFEYVPNGSLQHYLKGTNFATLFPHNLLITKTSTSFIIYQVIFHNYLLFLGPDSTLIWNLKLDHPI